MRKRVMASVGTGVAAGKAQGAAYAARRGQADGASGWCDEHDGMMRKRVMALGEERGPATPSGRARGLRGGAYATINDGKGASHRR